MSEKSKKRLKKAVLLMALLALIIGGAVFAKYIATGNGSLSMQLAKWNVEIGEIVLSNTHYTVATLAENKISPGTEGSFNITIDASNTETGVDYNVLFTDITNVPKNMYFIIGETEYASLAEVGQALSGHFNANDANKILNKTVRWKWDYETVTSKDGLRTTLQENDAQDTLDGEAAKTMAFNVLVTATQTRPVEIN